MIVREASPGADDHAGNQQVRVERPRSEYMQTYRPVVPLLLFSHENRRSCGGRRTNQRAGSSQARRATSGKTQGEKTRLFFRQVPR